MKRWVAFCACALVALFAFGCGGGSDDSDGGGTTATASNEPITLTVWFYGSVDPKVMSKIDEAYMAEHPNVTIKRVAQPAVEYTTLVRSAIAKRKGPDIIANQATPYAFDFKAGILPVNDMVTDQQRQDIVGWDQSTDKGDTLIVPFDANGVLFYYDKAKFTKAGLDPEAPPTTWDELLTACDKLNAAGIVPINAAFKDGGELELLLMAFLAQYQTDDELAKKISDPDYASPAISKTIDLMKDLYNRKCFTPSSEAINLFPDGVNNFKTGKGAMFLGFAGGDMHWAQWRETKWGKNGLGAFLPPLLPDSLWTEQKMQYSANSGHFITKWSPNPQAAYDYLMYLDTPEVQEQLFTEAGVLPSNTTAKAVSDDPVAQQILDWIGNKDLYLTQFQVARANVELLFLKHAPQIITGKTSYDDIAPDLVAEQQKSAAG